MSKQVPVKKASVRYTVWPENGPPKSFGPTEMQSTYYPHPKEDDRAEGRKKPA